MGFPVLLHPRSPGSRRGLVWGCVRDGIPPPAGIQARSVSDGIPRFVASDPPAHAGGLYGDAYAMGSRRQGNKNTSPVTVAASTAKPRQLIGTAGTVHGAQLPGR